MTYIFKYLMLLAIMFSTAFLSKVFGQFNPSQITFSNEYHVFLNFDGRGFDSGAKKLMKLSNFLSKESNKEGFLLKDNGIVIGKSGIYEISVSGNVSENEKPGQKEEYIVYINNTEVLKGNEVPGAPTGVFIFENQFKKGDILSIGATLNDKELKKSNGINMLTIRIK